MSECCSTSKGKVALYASVAANIFLVAFLLGHAAPQAPKPDMGKMMPGPGAQVQGPERGKFHGGMPPFFGPRALFSEEEMKANGERMRENFDKAGVLRKAFAEKLAAGPVTKEEALAHFAEVDGIMESVKKETQAKVAEKLSAMSDEDRQKFAKMLLDKDSRPPMPPEMAGGREGALPPPPPEAGGVGAPPLPQGGEAGEAPVPPQSAPVAGAPVAQ